MRLRLSRRHLFAWAMLRGVLSAQLPSRYEILGFSAGEALGMHIRRGGDVDQDGHDDILGFALDTNGSTMRILSGATGGVLLATPVPSSSAGFYGADTIGDLDDDGFPEIGTSIRDSSIANNNGGVPGELQRHGVRNHAQRSSLWLRASSNEKPERRGRSKRSRP